MKSFVSPIENIFGAESQSLRKKSYLCNQSKDETTENYYDTIANPMDTKTLEFVTYCISKLAQVLKLSQREVYRRLKQSGILYDYIVPSYDVLHTFSSRYLVEDLTDYMKEKGVLG